MGSESSAPCLFEVFAWERSDAQGLERVRM